MLRIRPFVMGYLIGAVMTGALAGAFISSQAAFFGALILLAIVNLVRRGSVR